METLIILGLVLANAISVVRWGRARARYERERYKVQRANRKVLALTLELAEYKNGNKTEE